MKIIIHGTYGGYKILYPSTESTVIVNDVRSEAATEHCIGVSFYSVAYNGNVVEYTKFIGIRDQKRSNAAGNIAVTISCSDGKKISGHDAVSILNSLTDEICKECVHDNYFDFIPDSWGFIDKYLNGSYLTSNIVVNKVNNNAKTCAYLYYSDDVELEKLMNRPDIETYGNYRQVFLIDRVHKGSKTNPVEYYLGKIDQTANLTNKYRINYNEAYTNITVIQNGNVVANNSSILLEGSLSVEYSKDYHVPQSVTIDLNEPENSQQYINIDAIGQIIHIKPIENLEPLKKQIHIIIKNEECGIIESASITCFNKDNGISKYADKNILSFIGDDLGRRWHISAKTIDGLESGDLVIIPTNINVDDYTIVVTPNKKVTLTASCNNHDYTSVTDFTATSELFETKTSRGGDMLFKGLETSASWRIKAENKDCQPQIKDCVPKNVDRVDFVMSRKQKIDNDEKPKPVPTKLIAIIATIVVVVVVAVVFIINGANKKKELLKKQAKNLEQRIEKNLNSSTIYPDSLSLYDNELKNADYIKYNDNLKKYTSIINDVQNLRMYIIGIKQNVKNDNIDAHSCFFAKTNIPLEELRKQYKKTNNIDIDDVCAFIDAYNALKAIEKFADNNKNNQITNNEKTQKSNEINSIAVKNDWTDINKLKKSVEKKVTALKVKTGGSGPTPVVSKESEITNYLKNGELYTKDDKNYVIYKKSKLRDYKDSSGVTEAEKKAINILLELFDNINRKNLSSYLDNLKNNDILKDSKFYKQVETYQWQEFDNLLQAYNAYNK